MTVYRRFGLNDRQIEIISRATPKRDYYCQSRRGNRLFELGLGEAALAFTAASSKTDQVTIAELVAEYGRDGFAAAWLRRKGSDLGCRPPPHPRHGAIAMNSYPFACSRRHDHRPPSFAAAPCPAQIAVFDPSNYSQNLMTAANTLKQIDNQLTALQNQTQMLLNQARHLTSLPTSLLNDIDRTFTQTQNLLKQVDKIAYDVQAIEQTFQQVPELQRRRSRISN